MGRKLQDELAYPPRGMRRVAAAAYLGLSTTKFDELVADGRMPKPKRVDTCVIWDRYQLDAAFDQLDGASGWERVTNERLHAPQDAAAPNTTTARSRPPPKSGRPRSALPVKEPAALDRLRAAGFDVYEDGEWEELVRKSPLGKRELAALEAFYRAKDEERPSYVKGAGFDTTGRLSARGYVEVWQERGHDRAAYYRITKAGQAEWIRLQAGKSS